MLAADKQLKMEIEFDMRKIDLEKKAAEGGLTLRSGDAISSSPSVLLPGNASTPFKSPFRSPVQPVQQQNTHQSPSSTAVSVSRKSVSAAMVTPSKSVSPKDARTTTSGGLSVSANMGRKQPSLDNNTLFKTPLSVPRMKKPLSVTQDPIPVEETVAKDLFNVASQKPVTRIVSRKNRAALRGQDKENDCVQ